MCRSTTESQTPEVARGASDTDANLIKAVDFATLISMSSLSAPDVQHDRLTGRKEIATRIEQGKAFGQEDPLASTTTSIGASDPIFECQVADELELRGHTFEAELRYRRLQGQPTVATRLAFLLDAKGFHRESWQWYLRAARENDTNALFRLATICWSLGDRGWAMRLAKHAVAQLVPEAYDELVAGIGELVRQRTAVSSPHDYIPVRSVLSSKTSADATYTLGSVLLVLASRPDLARLAYCSAMARGHSLAAVCLLDLARAAMSKTTGNWHLSRMLQGGLNSELQKYSPLVDQRDDFDRSLLLLKNEVQDETLDALIQAIRAATDRREDAIERIVLTIQLITILRCYGQLRFDPGASHIIDVVADAVCDRALHKLTADRVDDAASIINMIRDWSAEALTNDRQSEPQNSKRQKKKKRRGAKEHKKEVASGTLRRVGAEYSDLAPEQREVLILQVAGLYQNEVAKVLDCREVDADEMFADAVTRLQEAHQGEQLPSGKLLGAEVDNCYSPDILELITLLPEWNDTGATSWPRRSEDPHQLLHRRRARTMPVSSRDPQV